MRALMSKAKLLRGTGKTNWKAFRLVKLDRRLMKQRTNNKAVERYQLYFPMTGSTATMSRVSKKSIGMQ